MRAWQSGKNLLCNSADTYVKQMGICFFYVIGNFVPITQKRSAGMRTAAYNADVASDRRRRKNVPRHILCSVIGFRCQNILICIKKITYKIFEKTNINRHNAKRKYGTYAQKIVLTTYKMMQVAYKMVENAHKYNKNAQKEYLLWTHKMLICIK